MRSPSSSPSAGSWQENPAEPHPDAAEIAAFMGEQGFTELPSSFFGWVHETDGILPFDLVIVDCGEGEYGGPGSGGENIIPAAQLWRGHSEAQAPTMSVTVLELDEWIRRRVRLYHWKQWQRPGARRRNLIKLGIAPGEVHRASRSRKGYWRMSQN